MNRILRGKRPTVCLIDPYPSWLIKSVGLLERLWLLRVNDSLLTSGVILEDQQWHGPFLRPWGRIVNRFQTVEGEGVSRGQWTFNSRNLQWVLRLVTDKAIGSICPGYLKDCPSVQIYVQTLQLSDESLLRILPFNEARLVGTREREFSMVAPRL